MANYSNISTKASSHFMLWYWKKVATDYSQPQSPNSTSDSFVCSHNSLFLYFMWWYTSHCVKSSLPPSPQVLTYIMVSTITHCVAHISGAA